MSFTAGSVGGEYAHKLTVQELASHSHFILDQQAGTNTGLSAEAGGTPYTKATARADRSLRYWFGKTYESGENKAHNNVQPYITVFFWKRVK